MLKMNYVSPKVVAVLPIGDKDVAQNGIGYEGDYSGGEILVKKKKEDIVEDDEEEELEEIFVLPKAPNVWDKVW